MDVLVAAFLAAWFGSLLFLWFMARRHSAEALRDVAVAVKAFPLAGLVAAVARGVRRGR